MSDDLREVASLLGAWPYEGSTWAGAGVVPFGTDVLHTPTKPVEAFDDDLRTIADYMIEVMHERDGIGLAANQIGLPIRMFVHNVTRAAPQVIVNPRILGSVGTWDFSEGCLSMTVEGTHAVLPRPRRIVVECQDLTGTPLRIDADELLARVFQHEIDHLDGAVYAELLDGDHRERVFGLMADAGLDITILTDRR